MSPPRLTLLGFCRPYSLLHRPSSRALALGLLCRGCNGEPLGYGKAGLRDRARMAWTGSCAALWVGQPCVGEELTGCPVPALLAAGQTVPWRGQSSQGPRVRPDAFLPFQNPGLTQEVLEFLNNSTTCTSRQTGYAADHTPPARPLACSTSGLLFSHLPPSHKVVVCFSCPRPPFLISAEPCKRCIHEQDPAMGLPSGRTRVRGGERDRGPKATDEESL